MKNYICIECPMGCNITCTKDGEKINVVGNSCNRGKLYVINEETCPRRIITTTVKLEDGRMLPVKSNSPIKKDNMFNIVEILKKITVKSPVKIGDVVYKDIEDGIDIIATANR